MRQDGWLVQAQEGIKRASRGGMLTAAQLAAVAGLLAGAVRLQRAILSAAGQEGRLTEESALWPVVSTVKVSSQQWGCTMHMWSCDVSFWVCYGQGRRRAPTCRLAGMK